MADDPDLFGSDDGSQGDDERAPSRFFAALDAAGGRRGRPPGARNRKSVDFEKWYYAMGYPDPAQCLAELMTLDPLDLRDVARAAGMEPPDINQVLQIRKAAAADLMPYLHGKKPTEVVVTDERLPILVVASGTNQMAEAAKLIEGRQVLSIGAAPEGEAEPSEINGLEGDE